METGAMFLAVGLATIIVTHALRDPEDAKRYAKFLITGRGPNGGIGETPTSTVALRAPTASTLQPLIQS
jgi:hypothetical protein